MINILNDQDINAPDDSSPKLVITIQGQKKGNQDIHIKRGKALIIILAAAS